MKKRILRFTAVAIVFAALVLPSCDFLEECGYCELVTEENGEISNGTPLLYCGDNLIEKQNSSATTIGGVTTYYECD